MQHAYSSFNRAIKRIWGEIVGVDAQGKPLLPVVFEHPEPPDTLPDECLRVYWLRNGGSTEQPNERDALVQLDVFVPGSNRAEALTRAALLDKALGFIESPGFGRMGRFDWSTAPETMLSEMRVAPLEEGWVNVPDPKPRMVHYARTVILTYTV